MRTFLAVFVTGWTLFAAAGAGEGRDGNVRYRAGEYDAAARAYQRGLGERDARAPAAVTSALWNNLGLAHFRAGAPSDSNAAAPAPRSGASAGAVPADSATLALQNALRTAAAPGGRARAAYNAGTVAARRERRQRALARLRQALLADSGHADARFNFELVKRRLAREEEEEEQQQQQNQPPPDVQPSPFAERLKTRADSLVARRRYRDAYQLMTRGLQRDSTVRAFRAFIQRTGAVAQIDSLDS